MKNSLLLLALAAALPASAAPKSPAKKPTGKKPAGLAGRVLLPTGKPAAGARVWLGQAGPDGDTRFEEAKAGADGAFILGKGGKTGGVLWVGAAAAGAAPQWRLLDNKPGWPATPLTLKLPSPVAASALVIGGDGKPARGVRVAVGQLILPTPAPAADPLGRLQPLPPAVSNSLFGHSDPSGRVTLKGLPPGALLSLALPQDYLQPPFPLQAALDARAAQNLGIVPAIKPVSLQVLGLAGGQPAGGGAWLRSVPSPPQGPLAPLYRRFDPVAIELEADGSGLIEGLEPGAYEVAFHGKVFPVNLAEGEQAGPLKLEVAAASLSGKAVDAAGMPVDKARISVEVGRKPTGWPPGPANAVATDTKGDWTVADFPWEADWVTVRAQTRTELAEWAGKPSEIKGRLTLTLKPGTLVAVKGRLIGPDGKPVPEAPVALFTRDDDRPQALVVGKSDKDGRFQMAGLRRGVRFAVGSVINDRAFEGPFQASPEEGEGPDLGDVILAPSPGERTGHFSALLPAAAPSEADYKAAREALLRYLAAVSAGEMDAIRQLSSLTTPGAGPSAFWALRRTPLLLPPGADALKAEQIQPLRFIPRLLLETRLGQAPTDAAGQAVMQAADAPDWALFGYGGGKLVRSLALMHRDADGWKVVGGLDGSEEAGEPALLTLSPAPAQPDAALGAARDYLAAWNANSGEGMHALTHPRSREWRPAAADFRKLWDARPALIRPNPAGAEAKLESRFSAWDRLALFVLTQVYGDYRLQNGVPPQHDTSIPLAEIKDGRLALVSYQASGKPHLMLLLQDKGKWKVLDPAIPIGSA